MSVKMRFVALGVASALVLLLWFGVVYHPASSKLGTLRQEVQTSQNQATQLRSELIRLQGLKNQAPQLRADAARFTTALPSDPAVSTFIRLVQSAADAAHISFLSIAPSVPAASQAAAAAPAPPPASTAATPAPTATPSTSAAPAAPVTTPPPAVQAITIAITAKGTFFPMKDFIHRLEHLPRALRVTTFSISGGSAGAAAPSSGAAAPSAGGLAVNVTLSIFTAPAPTVAGPSVAITPVPGA